MHPDVPISPVTEPLTRPSLVKSGLAETSPRYSDVGFLTPLTELLSKHNFQATSYLATIQNSKENLSAKHFIISGKKNDSSSYI